MILGATFLMFSIVVIAVVIAWVTLLYWDIQEYKQTAITPLWIRKLKQAGVLVKELLVMPLEQACPCQLATRRPAREA